MILIGTLSDVKELWKRFQSQVFGFAIVEVQFQSILSFKPNVAKHVPLETLFQILDNYNDGRMDGLEFIGGLALCCDASFEDKARFCFEIFDFNLNASLSDKELVMLIYSCVCGMILLTSGSNELEPELEVVEAIVEDAFLRADFNQDGLISYDEFVFWARSNRDLMACLEQLNKVAADAKDDVDSDDSADEFDEGYLSDAIIDFPHLEAMSSSSTNISSTSSTNTAIPKWKKLSIGKSFD